MATEPDDIAALPKDVAWVYRHPALRRAALAKPGTEVLLKESDTKGAPMPGAIALLGFAVNNRAEFMKQVLGYRIKSHKEGSELAAGEEDPADIAQLSEFLQLWSANQKAGRL